MGRVHPDSGDLESYLRRTIRRVARIAQKAEDDHSWNAAILAQKEERLIRQMLDQVLELKRQLDEVPTSLEEHRQEIRLVVRRMRVAAQAAGSHVAAARLLQLEDEILSRHQAELTQAEQDALMAKTVAELTAEIERVRAQRLAH